MARPARHALPGNILSSARTFFATTKTSQGRALLQSERNATLMIDVLRSYVAARKFRLHDFCRNARPSAFIGDGRRRHDGGEGHAVSQGRILRSEEHTSELQSLRHLVCRPL